LILQIPPVALLTATFWRSLHRPDRAFWPVKGNTRCY